MKWIMKADKSGNAYLCVLEEEAMDHQVSPEPEYSASEASVCEDEDDDEDEDEDEEGGGEVKKLLAACTSKSGFRSSQAKLFSFSVISSYGTANTDLLPGDGNLLKLNSKCLPFIHISQHDGG